MLYSEKAVEMSAEVQRLQHLLMVAKLDLRDALSWWDQAIAPAKIARFARKIEALHASIELLEKEFAVAYRALSVENVRASKARFAKA
jgi:hypothetical protein